MKSRLRFILFILAGIFLILSVWQYRLIRYGLQQLKGQLHIVSNAQPIGEILNDPDFPDSLKNKLRLSYAVRSYATGVLGLKDSKNYTTVYDQKGKPALWVLTASEPFALKAYEWYFPFLGDVSYKGFFEKENGENDLRQLMSMGYDISFRPTTAWSTLGWFKDPLLSGMLKRSEGAFAELLLHELTHATLYLPGSVDYNENFATFIGEQGAVGFMEYHYGINSPQTIAYLDELDDAKTFGTYMLNCCSRLDSLYATIQNLNKEQKTTLKNDLIQELVSGINNLPLHHPELYSIPEDDPLPGNAWFLSYRRYRKDQEAFSLQLKEMDGDLKAFILHQATQ